MQDATSTGRSGSAATCAGPSSISETRVEPVDLDDSWTHLLVHAARMVVSDVTIRCKLRSESSCQHAYVRPQVMCRQQFTALDSRHIAPC